MTDLVVRPVRFTDQLLPMRRFYETIGMRPRVESERGCWVDLVAGAGMVALHSAASSDSGAAEGETRLAFEGDDVRRFADRLRDAGLPEVVVYDEAYGEVLKLKDPVGDTLVVDGRSTDLYGYRLHQADPDERLRVMPVRFTPPLGEYADFLERLGLPRREGDEFFAVHAGPDDAGQIGLHHVYEGELPIVPGEAAVHLTFETTEDLTSVRDRLLAAGYADAAITTDEFVSLVSVTDPDGQECQIHAGPQRR
jgi:hypothetical protein